MATPSKLVETKIAPQGQVHKQNGDPKPDIKAKIAAIADDLDATKTMTNADALSTHVVKAVEELRKLCAD